jgi:hypothetical protein
MVRPAVLLLAILPCTAPTALRAGEDWTRLKIGMSPAEATRALGSPLIRTAGQGFEVWIYDSRAEAVFYGPLVGWTAPHAADAPATVVDVWQETKGDPDGPRFFLPRPTPPKSVRRDAPVDDDNKLPYYRLR